MRFLIFAFLLYFFSCQAENIKTSGVTVNLKSPSYAEGVLKTDKGGVVSGPDFRLQAQNICYTKTKELHNVVASGFVMVDTGDYIFVGDRLVYDFLSGTGHIENAVTSDPPWYFGGDLIELLGEEGYVIHNGFITTSEGTCKEWQLKSKKVYLSRSRTITAKEIKLQFYSLPIFWLPSFKLNLCSWTEAPIKFYGRWGGKLGARIGVKYDLFTFRRFSTYLRLDWRFKRGPGGGLETYYISEDKKESLETINYAARDNSLSNPHEKTRYRFQGIYNNSLFDDKVTLRASWDKVSDIDMPTDYNDRGLELDTAGRTELLVRKQDTYWITNFRGRVRVNQFQTLKQELPTLLFTQKPYKIDKWGVIVENSLETSYLDFTYSNDLNNVTDYNAVRIEHNFSLYRPYQYGFFHATPEVGAHTMFYGNSYDSQSKFVTIGELGFKANAHFYKNFGGYKHTITPYLEWLYLTTPTVNPNEHYIFDIDDGLWRINSLKFGIKQNLFYKYSACDIQRLIEADLFSYTFIDSRPPRKIFAKITAYTFPSIKQTFCTGWDFTHNTLDHMNLRNEWTLSKDVALYGEWRHRSRYSYRKAVKENFILESFRSTKQLLASSVSDRRDTLLLHLYWRLHPRLALEFESRAGWNRRREPFYREFEIDLIATTKSHWNVKFSYQLKEDDHRLAIYFSLDSWLPSSDCSCLKLPLRF